jgi:hypothetical protein
VLLSLNNKFDDHTLAGMYTTGSKEEGGLDDDFYSFVSIPLTTP